MQCACAAPALLPFAASEVSEVCSETGEVCSEVCEACSEVCSESNDDMIMRCVRCERCACVCDLKYGIITI